MLSLNPKWLPMFPQIAAHPQKDPPCSCLCFYVTRGGHLTSLLPWRAGAESLCRVNTGLIRCFRATMSQASPADKTPLSGPLTRAETSWSQYRGRPPLCQGWQQQLSGNTLTGQDKLPRLRSYTVPCPTEAWSTSSVLLTEGNIKIIVVNQLCELIG